MSDTISWKEAYKLESANRLDIEHNKLCTFGIGHLDDALFGILPNDLVVIGADSGAGKSEIGITIAQHNAKKGKKVMMYFLEGGHIEAMARMKWRDITRIYFDKYTEHGVSMDYRKWRMNLYTEEEQRLLTKIDSELYNEYKNNYKENLNIYELKTTFTINDLMGSFVNFFDLEKAITGVKNIDLDLIIIDHLQYFDLTQGENEIQSTTRILKKVKEITNLYQVPVILISHLRKKTKDRGLPGQEDFYGSSNITKISSISITIAPDSENSNLAAGTYPTFFRICKSRTGLTGNFAIKSDFISKTREYSKQYELYKVNNFGAVDDIPLTYFESPEWARGKAKL